VILLWCAISKLVLVTSRGAAHFNSALHLERWGMTGLGRFRF
jgi:hypothetical protein